MSITKETAKYIVKNEAHANEVISLLERYGLLEGVGVRLVHAVQQSSEIISANQKPVLLLAKEHSDTEIAAILETHAVKTQPHVLVDDTVLDGYVLYTQGKKITRTAQDRINQFVNK